MPTLFISLLYSVYTVQCNTCVVPIKRMRNAGMLCLYSSYMFLVPRMPSAELPCKERIPPLSVAILWVFAPRHRVPYWNYQQKLSEANWLREVYKACAKIYIEHGYQIRQKRNTLSYRTPAKIKPRDKTAQGVVRFRKPRGRGRGTAVSRLGFEASRSFSEPVISCGKWDSVANDVRSRSWLPSGNRCATDSATV